MVNFIHAPPNRITKVFDLGDFLFDHENQIYILLNR